MMEAQLNIVFISIGGPNREEKMMETQFIKVHPCYSRIDPTVHFPYYLALHGDLLVCITVPLSNLCLPNLLR